MKDENLWSLDVEKTTSSTWKALLSLRGLAAQFIRAKIRNGQRISFWFDHWTPLGPLIHRFGDLGNYLSLSPLPSLKLVLNLAGFFVVLDPQQQRSYRLISHLSRFLLSPQKTITMPGRLKEPSWILSLLVRHGTWFEIEKRRKTGLEISGSRVMFPVRLSRRG